MGEVLITGGHGLLGSYFPNGALGRESLDVTNLDEVWTVFKERKPTIIIHLAACTDLTLCETDPTQAYEINAVGTYNVALVARSIGAKMLYVSTSGVFDGTKEEPYTENDIPNPVNIYGHSKYLGELAVSGMSEKNLIVRTSWLYGGGPRNDKKFVGKILTQQDAEIRVVNDKLGSPTYAKDLAAYIVKLIAEDARGIRHYSNGVASRFAVANELMQITHAERSVAAISSHEFPLSYNSGLNEGMETTIGTRSWQDALKEYVETEWNTYGT